MATKKEQEANEIDLELDRLARRARYGYEADHDQRWRDTYMKIDAARSEVRRLMSKADIERTERR